MIRCALRVGSALFGGAVSVALLTGCPKDPAGDKDPPSVVEGDGGAWEALAPIAGGPRQEIGVACLRDEVIIVGGFTAAGLTPRVDAYDPGTDSWRALADFPEPIHHANVAVVDDTLVVAGFLVASSFTPRGEVWRYDPDANSWSPGAPMPATEIRGAAGVAARDGFVYVFGGYQAGSVTTASRYDVSADTWETLPPLPGALDHLGAATIDGELFVVGGRADGISNHTDELLVMLESPGLPTWSVAEPMPTARGGFASAELDGELFVVGGEGAPNAAGVFAETEAYRAATNTWRALPPMRTPRHGMGACSLDGALYVPGGADVQAFAAVDTHERFVPTAENE